MSNFPLNFDDDTTLPFVNNNLTEIGGEAINAARDAIFQLEQEVGLGGSGTMGSIASRIGVSLLPDGTINPSAITSLGLVTLPITNDQIIDHANIPESKLRLDYRTSDLFNYLHDAVNDINTALGWITISGIKLEPHISGAIYRHDLTAIDVNADSTKYFTNKFRTYRDNTSAYTSLNDLNNELLAHQFADGYQVTTSSIVTNNGSTLSANYAHPASGVFLNSSRFTTIPQTTEDLQAFVDYIDNASVYLYGSRIQNLYSNGITKESRSSSLTATALGKNIGQSIVSTTPVIAYLRKTGTESGPVDDITFGDDIIEFKPNITSPYGNVFEDQFALVKVGDIVTINYGSVSATPIETSFIIKEIKTIPDTTPSNRSFLVRIAGKNLFYSSDAVARIDKSLVNTNKYGALAVSPANNGSSSPSLIVGSPRNAMALGLGFNPDLFDNSHYLLYLAVYPTGHPQDGYVILPAIDVTGNAGATPGLYSLETIVQNTNNKFRTFGYNYRFMAFSYQGEMGIMMTDAFNNAAFSILNAVVDGYGNYDSVGTNSAFPNNVVGVFSTSPQIAPDPLGFGSSNANIASPPFKSSYDTLEAATIATKIFIPFARNNYYVNGIEKDKLAIDVYQSLDGYGDGYWLGYINNKHIYGSPGRVEVTYRIEHDLSSSLLAPGKTLVVQSYGSGSFVDYGRFIIKDINFVCGGTGTGTVDYTDITVYDAVHGMGSSPVSTADSGTFRIYFGSDSIGFNKETATDYQVVSASFKRHFEVFTDYLGQTFTHERGRVCASTTSILINNTTYLRSAAELLGINVIRISPKLRGYTFGSVTKITLRITSFTSPGIYSGYLCSYDGGSTEDDYTRRGPLVTGRIGEVTRFYDETGIDYIDIFFELTASLSALTGKVIDFQLFPTLSLDNEVMMIATCQLNDLTNTVDYFRDQRQFGNTSEKELSTSAIDFISLPDKLLHANGIISGFDLVESTSAAPNPNVYGQIRFKGGKALINGKIVYVNNEVVPIPPLKETYLSNSYSIVWAVCINDKSEYKVMPLLDYDPSIPTPNQPLRNIYVYKDLASPYHVDANTFSDIVYNRKDLVLLYVVYSTVNTVSPVDMDLITIDVRRYVSEVDNNLPMRLNGTNSCSNFKGAVSIFNWLKFNNTYNGIVNLRNTSATLAVGALGSQLKIGGSSTNIVIDGENTSSIGLTANQVVISSNVTIKNMTLNFGGQIPGENISIETGAHDITFENCTININVYSLTNPALDFESCQDITISNCTINFIVHTVVFSTNYLVKIVGCTNFKFYANTVTATYYPSTSTSSLFYVENSPRTVFSDSSFSGHFVEFLKIGNNSDGIKVTNCTITTSFNPYNTYAHYTQSDLVNAGTQAVIHASVYSSLDDIEIDSCVFNYTPDPASVATAYDRYTFVNFDLVNNVSTIKNLRITGCRFNDNNIPSTLDSVRAAIAIVNLAETTTNYFLPQPMLLGVKIADNTCNKNQTILVTSMTSSTDGYMLPPGLQAQNCSIRNNVCGNIGYWTSAGVKYPNIAPYSNSLNDKGSNLSIEFNTCHYIASMDHTGKYFAASKTTSGNWIIKCGYTTGFVSIRNNNANWIHVGLSYEDNSFMEIVDNNLYAYDWTYLNQFGEVFTDPTGAENYAITVLANPHTTSPVGFGNGSPCIISGNTTNIGRWVTMDMGSTYTLSYWGAVYTTSSATITKNIFKGINGRYTVGMINLLFNMISVGGKVNICTDNQLYRSGTDIASYIGFIAVGTPPWYGVSGSSGIITGNFFDSPYTDIANTLENTIDTPYTLAWNVEKNINQTVTRYLSFANALHSHGSFLFPVIGSLPNGVYMFPFGPDLHNGFIINYNAGSTPGFIVTLSRLDLSNIIPVNTYLTNISVTVDGYVAQPTSTFSTSLILESYVTGLVTPDIVYSPVPSYSFTPGVTDSHTYSLVMPGIALFNNIQTGTQGYLYLTLQANMNSPTYDLLLQVSAVKIKYRW